MGLRIKVQQMGIGCAAALLLAAGACASDSVQPCPVCPDAPEQPVRPDPKRAKPPLDQPAPSRDRGRIYAFKGFSEDGDKFALRMTDEAVGSAFLIYDAATQKPVKTYVFASMDEDDTWSRARRRYKISDASRYTQTKPGGTLTMMAADDATHLVLFAMDGDRAVPYLRIPRLTGADDQMAAVSVPFMAWEPTGRYLVLIHHQAMEDPRFESDYVDVIDVDERRLPF